MTNDSDRSDRAGLRAALPRLVAEFFVIVVGVLVALGVDSWASWRSDRELEREYLERLLDDVRYDLDELDDVTGNSTSGAAYADSLMHAGFLATVTPARLAGTLTITTSLRVPDLSRGTFNELLASGRIGLIRSRTVRSALAQYERTLGEVMGFWDLLDRQFHDWARRRMPRRAEEQFYAACGDPLRRAPERACEFVVDSWDSDRVLRELRSDEVRLMLNYDQWAHGATVDIAGLMRDAALELHATLEQELNER